jgi:hypothetical protein
VSHHLYLGGRVISPRDVDFETLCALAEQVPVLLPVLAGRELAAAPLPAVLALAGVDAYARSILVEADSSTGLATLSLEAVERSVVVYRIGRLQLPYGLGGPFRLMTRGRSSMGDIKQVTALYVSDQPCVDRLDERAPPS